jgi:hypothetical protein
LRHALLHLIKTVINSTPLFSPNPPSAHPYSSPGNPYNSYQILPQRILILLQEILRVIVNRSGEVIHAKPIRLRLDNLEVRVALVSFLELVTWEDFGGFFFSENLAKILSTMGVGIEIHSIMFKC